MWCDILTYRKMTRRAKRIKGNATRVSKRLSLLLDNGCPLTSLSPASLARTGLPRTSNFCNLHDLSTTSLLHAGAKWKGVVNAYICPYTLRAARNDVMSTTPLLKSRKILQQLFSRTEAFTVLRHFCPFDCLLFMCWIAMMGQSIPSGTNKPCLGSIWEGPRCTLNLWHWS